MTAIATLLVLLHGPGGREILLNPELVVSMHAATTKPNTALTEAVRCLINTNDGKFISVVESCEQVQALFRERVK